MLAVIPEATALATAADESLEGAAIGSVGGAAGYGPLVPRARGLRRAVMPSSDAGGPVPSSFGRRRYASSPSCSMTCGFAACTDDKLLIESGLCDTDQVRSHRVESRIVDGEAFAVR
jgi:hypothetical protein